MEQTMRLNKYLAHSGVCSRRDADKLIAQGQVSVNGQPAQPGQSVSELDEVCVLGKRACLNKKTVVLAFYKPVGVVCTERDNHAEVKISDVLQYPERLTYAGRLDKDSEGLLLLTNDGNLIQEMMRAAGRHEKEYLVEVNKEVTPEFIQKMSGGIFLRDLNVTTRKCKVEKIEKNKFRIILTQGFNRQIKRMCKESGCYVKSIKRVRVMSVILGDLRPGEFRELSGEEVQSLYRECGMELK